MDNLLTYIKFRGDLSFKQSPFNEVDAMVFAVLVGIDYEGAVGTNTPIREVSDLISKTENTDPKDMRGFEKKKVLFACAESKRYGGLLFSNYSKIISYEEETTFYGLTIFTSKREAFVLFRGTDGSLISWKENFVTLYEMPTRGQHEALSYLSKACSNPFVKVNVIGHSKGGNLAVYAAMCLDERLSKRVKKVYAFDSPGFISNIEDKLTYQLIKDRIEAYVPVSCVVGNLMNPPYARKIVAGEGVGIYQHDLFTWKVNANGLELLEDTNSFSKDISEKMNSWIESMPIENRKAVSDELFDMFIKNDILHISDLLHMDIRKIFHIIRDLTSLSPENREFLGIIIKEIRQSK